MNGTPGTKHSNKQAFTLIELLVVIAVIAVLAVVLVLTLNPAELLKQARDSNRLSDLDTLNKALSIYSLDTGGSMGNASTIYISIPDQQATSTQGDQCQGLVGLPSLPAGWSYHCASSSAYRNTDGTGWIPLNFKSVSSGSPLGALPADPVNTSSSRLYYTYTTNGSQYETTATMESQRYKLGGTNDVISNDGGTLASVYEKGSKLGLEPLDYGDSSLVGLWTFDEGTGTTVYDYSGNNATGSWNGTLGSQWTTGKVGGYAGQFASSNSNLVSVPSMPSLGTPSAITAMAWINYSPGNGRIFQKDDRGSGTYTRLWEMGVYSGTFRMELWHSNGTSIILSGNTVTAGWQHVAMVFDGSKTYMYQNGVLTNTATFPGDVRTDNTTPITIGGQWITSEFFSGAIDDVRIYNRALSAAEILAMYNAMK